MNSVVDGWDYEVLGPKPRAEQPDASSTAAWNAVQALTAELTRLRAALSAEEERGKGLEDAGRSAVSDFDALVSDSEGVYGLHLNGDPAPWADLTSGGRFEEWTAGIEKLRAALEAKQ